MHTDTAATNDPALKSWVESANDPETDFPIQNLPFGVFTPPSGTKPETGTASERRIGVAIGDQILDVRGAVEARLLDDCSPAARCALSATSLNDFMRLGRAEWASVRTVLSRLLERDTPTLRDDSAQREMLLVSQDEATMHLPAVIGDFTDFYAAIHHATNVGSMFRPDNPLMPNYRHLPVGYHGRASSIVVDGTPVRRPMGQTKADDAEQPVFGPCRLLDYELEMGAFIGPGNELGRRIPIDRAMDHLFGIVLLNDWSARDVQKWEYQPLGPFNAKNFASTISPWVVTMAALEPYRTPVTTRTADDPPLLDYLRPTSDEGFRITLEVSIRSAEMARQGVAPTRISHGSFAEMYWTFSQMLAHHTSTGCNMCPGDLIGSGTVSGPTPESRGCLLERTWRGSEPITLGDGSQRKFLQDGDEVTLRGWCEGDGHRIGFGACRGTILPAE